MNRDIRTVSLAGATGTLGREVHRELIARGLSVRRLVRFDAAPGDRLCDLRDPDTLRGVCDGVDAVVSCAGAAMRLSGWNDRAGFEEIDFRGNDNLLAVAKGAGVKKFVYVSLAHGREMMHTAYARGHERFVDSLAGAGIPYTVVRPTGLFAFFSEILRFAARGRGIVAGSGAARTNPIHEADAAIACSNALLADLTDLPVGGPVIYTRLEIVHLAFRALQLPPRIQSAPVWAFRAAAPLMRIFNPRIAALVEFGLAVSQVDCIAPAFGTRRLDRYFGELAGRQ